MEYALTTLEGTTARVWKVGRARRVLVTLTNVKRFLANTTEHALTKKATSRATVLISGEGKLAKKILTSAL